MDSVISSPSGALPATPRETPLDMPTQSLTHFSRAERRAPRAPERAYTPWLSRLFIFGGALAITIYGAYQMYRVVEIGEITLMNRHPRS